MGLQTVTWLFEGDVLHRDSLGSEQLISSGQLNLMTSGRGIAHSEQSPDRRSPRIHGVQLWVALPDHARGVPPAFEHHASLPTIGAGGMDCRVFVGSFGGVASPAHIYSDMVGVDITAHRDVRGELPLEPGYEHVLMATLGSASVGGAVLEPGALLYLGPGTHAVDVQSHASSRLMLLGGKPFGERILMWWNFVARTPEEIAVAVEDWNQLRRFGEVDTDTGDRLAAPVPDLTRLRLR
jgi:redox-sensitive bicupin YhaK (pirin superfamily)